MQCHTSLFSDQNNAITSTQEMLLISFIRGGASILGMNIPQWNKAKIKALLIMHIILP